MSAVATEIKKRVAKHRSEQIELRRHLLEIASQPDAPLVLGPEERLLLEQAGWDAKKIRREYASAREAWRKLQIAGTEDARQAIEETASKAEQRLESEGQAIRSQIEKLQKQLNSMEREAELTNRRLEEAQSAFDDLRADGLLPDFVKDEIRAKTARMDEGLGREISDLEIERHQLEIITTEPAHGDIHKDRQYRLWLETVERFDRAFVEQLDTGGSHFQRRLTVTYRNALPKLAERIREIERQISELKAKRSDALEAIDELRDFWIELAN